METLELVLKATLDILKSFDITLIPDGLTTHYKSESQKDSRMEIYISGWVCIIPDDQNVVAVSSKPGESVGCVRFRYYEDAGTRISVRTRSI